MTRNTQNLDSPLGTLTVIAQGDAIVQIAVNEPILPDSPSDLTEKCANELVEYFEGKRSAFDLPLRPAGTAFQQKVWQALATIPYGQTVTYGQIAGQIGCPRGYQAVGQAVGKNPIPIVLPCHRVFAASGIGGFSLGLRAKRILLDIEKIIVT